MLARPRLARETGHTGPTRHIMARAVPDRQQGTCGVATTTGQNIWAYSLPKDLDPPLWGGGGHGEQMMHSCPPARRHPHRGRQWMAAPDARSGDEAATEELLSEVDDLTPWTEQSMAATRNRVRAVRHLLNQPPHPNPPTVGSSLTPRDLDILRRLRGSQTLREIATDLRVTQHRQNHHLVAIPQTRRPLTRRSHRHRPTPRQG
jgi:DNA-binding CsgD family transcriptional regulator